MPHAFPNLAIALGGCLLVSGALAQTKADGEWRGAGGASLSVASGNTSSTAFLLNLDMARQTVRDKITLGAYVNYARSGSGDDRQTTANKWAAAGQYDYNLSARTFAFGKLGLEADRVVDLSLRTSLTGGLGYHVIQAKDVNFDVFGGAGYTIDRYSGSQTIAGATDTRFSRATLLFGEESNHQFNASTSFKQRLEIYPGLTEDKAVLIKFSAGLNVAMTSTVSLTVGVTDAYNSRPPAGRKNNDLGLFTGVSVKLGAM